MYRCLLTIERYILYCLNVFTDPRLPDEATIFSAEAKAIDFGFEHIKMS